MIVSTTLSTIYDEQKKLDGDDCNHNINVHIDIEK